MDRSQKEKNLSDDDSEIKNHPRHMSGVLFSGSSPPKADYYGVFLSKSFNTLGTEKRSFAFVPRGNMAPL